MIANLSEFLVVLARYEDDPGVCSKLLRTYSLTDPAAFLNFSQSAILERPVARVTRFLASLAVPAGVIPTLIELYGRDRRRALDFAARLQQCEPRFDAALIEFLTHPAAAPSTLDEGDFHRVLDLLDHVSEGDRLVPSVLKLLKHSNPRIRSKAALFVGSRTQNMAWATSRTGEYDARVRANILESLFGLNSDLVRQLFSDHVADENNRVAGNAVYGLYQIGDVGAIAMIYDMASHADARFRNTAAWLMGRTGDPRFTTSFVELLNDADELVRAQAFKSLGEIRKAMRAASSLPTLEAALLQPRRASRDSALITVTDAAGQPVRGIEPTRFILKAGSPAKPVRQFSVEEYDSRHSLHLGLLLALPADAPEAVDACFRHAAKAICAERRTKDRLAVAKVSGRVTSRRGLGANDTSSLARQKWAILNVAAPGAPASAPFDPQLEYSHLDGRIQQMLADEPLLLADGADDADALLNRLLRVEVVAGRPAWIVLGAGSDHPLLARLKHRSHTLHATVHVLAWTPEWLEVGQLLAQATDGSVHFLADLEQAEDRMRQVVRSLLHHYRVSWPAGASTPVEVDVYCDRGRAHAEGRIEAGSQITEQRKPGTD